MKKILKEHWPIIMFIVVSMSLFLCGTQCGTPGGTNSDHLYYVMDRKAGVVCFSTFATFSSIGCLPLKDTNLK